ncbi:hypothetical protein [Microlunatus sp. GCM10028923]|uniref:hypothetical protein n=1 Tax=Microlunatus sp. GCM10028923 TaxID=3273400 RepID=UPI00361446C8
MTGAAAPAPFIVPTISDLEARDLVRLGEPTPEDELLAESVLAELRARAEGRRPQRVTLPRPDAPRTH